MARRIRGREREEKREKGKSGGGEEKGRCKPREKGLGGGVRHIRSHRQVHEQAWICIKKKKRNGGA